MLRSAESGDWIGTFQGHKGAVWNATISADATRALTAAADGTMRYWDALTGDELYQWTHDHIVVKACDFNSDATSAVSGCNDKKIRIFDLNQLDAEPRVIQTVASPSQLRFSPDDKRVIGGSRDESFLRAYDVDTLEEVMCVELSGPITYLRITVDREHLLVAAGKTVSLLSVHGLEKLWEHKVDTDVESCAVHPDHSVFVTGGADNVIRLHSASTGEVLESSRAHHGPVHSCAFHPLGTSYATGAGDSAIRIWPYNAAPEKAAGATEGA
jgi:serine-threonine kinase receptor-associated protein